MVDRHHGFAERKLPGEIHDGAGFRRHDEADVMIAGGTEAVVSPLAVGGFSAMRALSTRNDDPQRAGGASQLFCKHSHRGFSPATVKTFE